jgi:hypothetical protein
MYIIYINISTYILFQKGLIYFIDVIEKFFTDYSDDSIINNSYFKKFFSVTRIVYFEYFKRKSLIGFFLN